MTQAMADGNSPQPGFGPGIGTREHFYTRYFIVGETEDGKFATCRYDGGEPYEVTAIVNVCAAIVLAETPDDAKPQDCGGFVTPAYAFAGTSFVDLCTSTRWAAKENGAHMSWTIEEGKPDQEEVIRLIKAREKDYVVKMGSGELRPQALPDYKA